ncbi:MAG: hypothetical protein IH597_14300 [Bacteroidales bacterium]|nr:hypothetical protein [Bacteroidales bacterium]
MKKLIKPLFLIIAALMIYSGCDKLDVDFDANFKTNLNVIVPADGLKNLTGYPFSESEFIDPMDDSDFAKYADKIKEIKVKELTAEVTSINKPVSLVSCDFSVSSSGYVPENWSFENEDIFVGKVFTLANTNGQWDNVQTILDNKEQFTVSMAGETDQDDVQFTIEVIIKSEITANPL